MWLGLQITICKFKPSNNNKKREKKQGGDYLNDLIFIPSIKYFHYVSHYLIYE